MLVDGAMPQADPRGELEVELWIRESLVMLVWGGGGRGYKPIRDDLSRLLISSVI